MADSGFSISPEISFGTATGFDMKSAASDFIDLPLPSGKTTRVSIRISSRARHLRLRIMPYGSELVIPEGFSRSSAISFLREQAAWLERNLPEKKIVAVERPQTLRLEFTNETFRIEYQALDAVWTGVRATSPETLLVSGNISTDAVCIQALKEWLKRKARKELLPYAEGLCRELGFAASGFAIGLQSRVWGTCSSKRKITLNSALLFFPENIVRYVVVHEGCHITEMNHSVLFWNLVRKYYPYPEHARRVLNAKNALPAWLTLPIPEET